MGKTSARGRRRQANDRPNEDEDWEVVPLDGSDEEQEDDEHLGDLQPEDVGNDSDLGEDVDMGGTGDEDDEDDDAPLEVLALSDLRKVQESLGMETIREHIHDRAGLRAKLSDISKIETLGFLETLNLTHTPREQLIVEDDPATETKQKRKNSKDSKKASPKASIVNDDLKREALFATVASEAVKRGLQQLRAANVPFRRPDDYLAEMVKTDHQMQRVKKKMVHERDTIAAAQQRRKQRTNKKEARKIQIEKEQSRKHSVKQEVAAVEKLRKERVKARARKGKDEDEEDEGGADDDFPVDLLDFEELKDGKFVRGKHETKKDDDGEPRGNSPKQRNKKREEKNKKFGFGGKKKGAKRNDAKSASKTGDFSRKKNNEVPDALRAKLKGGVKKGAKGAKKRPGKSRRQKSRAS
eukprot:Plantae.Rhodophyta-Rhodochaete_pulchella.ctg8356.p2 GENE.Plantae.Rhodophyta-Rhodochaete_pulchella.ctg8356~~Plantae.Rhodophyta-Rhodochaete_pulchella.ctg8356.p2  ORF type:complete len:411 (+),score=115.51 Plantae.Rhodophyta-Rhodochaete_pulchella.ctg8356:85-1317(+)